MLSIHLPDILHWLVGNFQLNNVELPGKTLSEELPISDWPEGMPVRDSLHVKWYRKMGKESQLRTNKQTSRDPCAHSLWS